MKHRAIKYLNQLADSDFFQEISKGLDAIYENCSELNKSYELLIQNNNYRASRVIRGVLIEEAAKYLILIDALRCPRKNNDKEFTRQLEKFNDHLAKGVYAELCSWKPDTYNRLCEYIAPQLDEYYLDGPNGVDFVFRNNIISTREQAMYVDYAQIDDAHTWLTPQQDYELDDLIPFSCVVPSVVKMVMALHGDGISKIEFISSFSMFWRGFVFDGNTRYQQFKNANHECLKILDKQGLLQGASEDTFSLIINEMPFPLYKEEMKEKKIKLSDLKEKQQNWCPDYY
jgi:AbiV family abortive infection protein